MRVRLVDRLNNEAGIRPLVLTALLIVLGSAIAFGFVGSTGSQGMGPAAAPPATDPMDGPDDGQLTDPGGTSADGSVPGSAVAARADNGSNPGGLPASDRGGPADDEGLTTLATGSADDTDFSRIRILSGYDQPIAFTFLPDGRMILLQKNGKMFIANATGSPVAAEPYMTVPDVRTFGEQGLLDITLDPDFADNGRFYVYYTNETVDKNRISRFEHVENGSGLDSYGRPDSEQIIWQNEATDASVCCHFGGGLDVGPEGRLWLTTGDQFNGSAAQDRSVPNGKIIRVNRNGSIPSANPFTDDPDALDSIYAYGLRNPYRAGFDPATDRFFVGEVGGNDDTTAREDINLAEKGANYGWPDCEGFCDNQNYTDPIYTYPHNGSGASVTVGPVYRGDQFPPSYDGALFYSDYVRGWIKYLSFDASGNVTNSSAFYETGDAVVQVNQGPDGSLYYTDIVDGGIYRIEYTGNQPPRITETAANRTSGTPPLTVEFAGNATDADGDDLTYTWAFGDGTEATGRTAVHTYTSNGSYDAYLEVSDGTTTVSSDRITVEVGAPPSVTITNPANGTLFRAGETVTFEANGTDPDGTLNESRYRWDLLFNHDEHTHPGLDDIDGSTATYATPTDGHDYSGDTGYTATVTVTDSDGLTETDSVFVDPEKVNLTFRTDPAGLEFTLDDRSLTAPNQYDTLVNFTHTIAASETQCVDGTEYSYANWSDGGARVHDITVPETDTVYTARYESTGTCEQLVTDGLVLQLGSGMGVSTSSGTVTDWIDQSGQGNDLTAAGDPTLQSNATPSGAPAVSFDGDGDALLRTDTLNRFPTANQNRSVFLVADYQSAGFGGFAYGNAACNQAFGTIVDEAGNLEVQGWCGANDYPTTASGTGPGWLTQSATLSGNNLTHYRNGSVIDTATHSYDTKADRLVLGAELTPAPYLDMEVGSVLVYDRSLSDTERQQVQRYLADRYLTARDSTPPAYVNGSLNATLVETRVPNGTTTNLVVEAEFTNGTTRRVTGSVDLTSNDTSVATVGSTGTVTAKSRGVATVNATFESESDTDTLTVEPATYTEDSLSITLANSTIVNGTTSSVTVEAEFTNGTTRDITSAAGLSSNDTTVASVSDTGSVSAVGDGSATIEATYENDTSSATLTVESGTYVSGTLNATLVERSIPNGTTTTLVVTAEFTNGRTQEVTTTATPSSDATDVATVDDGGRVTAKREGSATVSVEYRGDSDSEILTVESAAYLGDSLTVEVADSSIANGTTTAVRAEAGFTNGTTQDVTGSATVFSADPAIATVSEDTVTAERTGSVDIVAEYSNETVSAGLTIESAAYVPGSLNVTVAESPIPNGTTTSVTVDAEYTDGTTRDLTDSVSLSSNDTDAVTIDDGTITANTPGRVSITADYEGDSDSETLVVEPAPFSGSLTVTARNSSIIPRSVNESSTTTHDIAVVFENVSRDGNTDTFAITFPDAVAGENLSANAATVTSLAGGEELSISSGLSRIDGPDQDGVMDTLTFAVSPDGAGTVDVVANASVDVTWPAVDANTTYTIGASAEDSATGNVSLTPVANATVVDTETGPEPRATEVSLVPDEKAVSPGQATTYEVVVANASGGVGAHNTTVTLGNPGVASITAVSLRGDPGQQNVEIASDNSSVTIEAALMDTTDTGAVTIATVTVEGTDRGTTGVNLTVDAVGTEAGGDYAVTGVENASLGVTLPPVAGFDSPPTDPDGDGFYEDINGNGEANVVDVQAMFANREDSVLTENPQLFDFSGNGAVDVVDVQALFAELSS